MSPREFDSRAKQPRGDARQHFHFRVKLRKYPRARARAHTHARTANRDDRTVIPYRHFGADAAPFEGRAGKRKRYNRTDIFRLNIIKFTREGTRGRTRGGGRGERGQQAFTRNGRSFSLAAAAAAAACARSAQQVFPRYEASAKIRASRARNYLIWRLLITKMHFIEAATSEKAAFHFPDERRSTRTATAPSVHPRRCDGEGEARATENDAARN